MQRRMVFILALPVALFMLVMGATSAFASSPHFVKGPTYTATTTELTATGQAAGLANAPTAAFLTATSVNVYFHCTNHGNNFAPGHPASQSPATGPTENITPRNGTIKFDVTLPAPVPSPASVCPNKNWNVVIDETDYLGVVLHIQQNGLDILSDGPHDFTSCAAGIGACVFTG